jgi:hypothetical protein
MARDAGAQRLRKLVLVVPLVFYMPYLALHAFCITGLGLWGLWYAGPFHVVMLVAVPASALGLFLLCIAGAAAAAARGRARQPRFVANLMVGSAYVLAIVLPIVVFAVPMARLADSLHRRGYALALERTGPLVAALHRFDLEHGRPPRTLAELVPASSPPCRAAIRRSSWTPTGGSRPA